MTFEQIESKITNETYALLWKLFKGQPLFRPDDIVSILEETVLERIAAEGRDFAAVPGYREMVQRVYRKVAHQVFERRCRMLGYDPETVLTAMREGKL